MTIRQFLDASPMKPWQWLIVAVATVLNALDGYDVLAMAFTANSVSAEFDLSSTELGWLLSAGLLGMAAGSLIFGPLADRYGRRPVLLSALAVNFTGLLLSGFATGALTLGLWRVVTGLGVGGILATITVLVSEYANRRARGMAISIYTAGYGIGATLGGLGAAHLIPLYGWRSVFFAGAAVTAVAVLVTAVVIPESVDFLGTRRNERAQRRLAAVARRVGFTGGDFTPATAGTAPAERPGLGELLGSRYRMPTLVLWTGFFLIMFGFYFANSWTPKLLVEVGMSEQQGILGGLLLALGGTFGSLLYGAVTTKWKPQLVLSVFAVLCAADLVLFITSISVPLMAFASGVTVGMLINGCVAGLYTVAPQTYAPQVRAAGVGWGIGIGRFGAILAPILVGSLLDAGWTPVSLYVTVAIALLVGAIALWRIRPYRHRDEQLTPRAAESTVLS